MATGLRTLVNQWFVAIWSDMLEAILLSSLKLWEPLKSETKQRIGHAGKEKA
jgi:hypothetical protein